MFNDHFSRHAKLYASARPTYPKALFEFITSLCEFHDLAWDCGTGNGQAAVPLAELFKMVVATDASAKQIQYAECKPNIQYTVCLAENSGIENESVDLVTVATALHWFNIEAFFQEAKRVLKSDGIIALWCYRRAFTESEALNKMILEYYDSLLAPYTPTQVKYADSGYAQIHFPFDRLNTPEFLIQLEWTVGQLLAYYSSHVTAQRYKEEEGECPAESWLKPKFLRHYADLETKLLVTIPLTLMVGKNG